MFWMLKKLISCLFGGWNNRSNIMDDMQETLLIAGILFFIGLLTWASIVDRRTEKFYGRK